LYQNLKKITFDWRLKKSRERNKITINVHEYQWHKNLLRNSKNRLFKEAKTIRHIAQEIGEGKVIYIVGAGYSLEEKKDEIKFDGIIFCLDASLRYLVLEMKVIPDFVFILDSKKEGMRFFKDIPDKILKQIKIVVSSAVDKEFIEIIKKFKEIYAFHMYDPSMPDWGGNSTTVAHKLLPNLAYIPNKGNVFNLALQVAFYCKPAIVYGIGTEHCYKIDKNGNLRTRASVNDGFNYEIGGNFCRFDKIFLMQDSLGRMFYTQGDYYNYALMANDIISKSFYKYKDLSEGLVISNVN